MTPSDAWARGAYFILAAAAAFVTAHHLWEHDAHPGNWAFVVVFSVLAVVHWRMRPRDEAAA